MVVSDFGTRVVLKFCFFVIQDGPGLQLFETAKAAIELAREAGLEAVEHGEGAAIVDEVAEGDGVVTAGHDLGRNLAGGDSAEDAIGGVHGPSG